VTAGLALSAAQPLGARCADGRAQELAGAIAAAGNGAAPAGGAAAAAVLRELHRLGSADAAAGPPGEDAGAGAGAVAAEAAEAVAVLAAVQRGAEPAPRGVLQHLDAVLAAVRGGGVEVTPDARRVRATCGQAACMLQHDLRECAGWCDVRACACGGWACMSQRLWMTHHL